MSETGNYLASAGDSGKADGTAEARRQVALLKTGALQTAILTSANFSIIATDEKGIIQLFNVGAERMLGYSAAEVVNRISPSDIHDPQEVAARAQALSIELATPIAAGFEALAYKASRGIEDSYELTYIRKDGGRFPAIISITALRDDYREVIGYLLIGADNSVRYRIQDALQKSEERYRTVFNAMFEGFCIVEMLFDADNRAIDYRFVEVNSSFEAQTGIRDAKGKRMREIAPEHEEHWFEIYGKVALTGESVHFLNEAKALGRWFEVSAHRLNDGANRNVAILFQDITERRKAEAERGLFDQALQGKNVELERSRAVAEKANLAKSDFLSSMSHELRTPLSAILGFAQLIESGSPSPTAAQKRSVDQILKAGWYLLELINEILDLALIESGKLPLSLEPISLTEVVRECHAMIEPQAQKRDIRMTFPEFKLPYFVMADRTRVKQVLINLLSNAVKYNKVGGTVVVECIANAPGRIRICIEDTGQGLSAAEMAQLFQPFNRLGKEAGIEEGTGIGLMVSKRLVELMQGEIGVESTVGAGSVFWIELNLTAAPPAVACAADPTAVAKAQVHSNGRTRTLLYVEDNPANLLLVEDLIARRPDIRLLSATDGNRGVEVARASLPDVILMDINLPGVSGIRALEILRADPATAHIPVIALSANAIPRDIKKGLDAGFFRYLTKPIKVNEFMDTLDVALKFAKAESARANKEVKKDA